MNKYQENDYHYLKKRNAELMETLRGYESGLVRSDRMHVLRQRVYHAERAYYALGDKQYPGQGYWGVEG